MRSVLSLFRRLSRRRPTSARRVRPALETLEARLAPAATDLYVVTQAASFSGSLLKEYTPTGVMVRSVPVPTGASTEYARDLAVTGTQFRVYNGTFDPVLSTYDGPTGTWTDTAGPAGWSTVNNVSYGGFAVFGTTAFATDMRTFGDPADELMGIVRINMSDGTSDRFATDFEPIDLAAGLDGFLYALDDFRTVRVYDPTTTALLRTITLPFSVTPAGATSPVSQDYRSLAVDAGGLLYVADWSRTLTRFDANGTPQLSRTLPGTFTQGPGLGNLTDIDILPSASPAAGPQLVVGSWNGIVGLASAATLSYQTSFSVGGGTTFVATGPALAELNIADAGLVTEGSSGTTVASFTVTLSSPVDQPVSVQYSTSSFVSGFAATAGVDYQAVSGAWLTFAPGETSKTIEVPVTADTLDELDERFSVVLAYYPSGAVLNRTTGTATIVDDDAAPTSATAPAVSAGYGTDSQGDGVFESFTTTTGTLQPYNYGGFEKRVVMEFDTAGVDTATLPYASLEFYEEFPYVESTTVGVYGYAGDGAAAGNDLAAPAVLLGQFSPIPGTAWRRVVLDRAAVDGLRAQSGVIGLRFATADNTFFDIHGLAAAEGPRLTFWSGEPPTAPMLHATGSSVTEGNPGSTQRSVPFTVTLSPAVPQTVTVRYQTVDGSARAGSDYTAVSGTLTFGPGETSKTVQVPVTADLAYEPTEAFNLRLSEPNFASFNVFNPTGTIANDDAQPTVSVGPASVLEPNPTTAAVLGFVVTLSAPSYQTVSVNYATANGTAVAGLDYFTAGGVLTFAPGETSKTIPVTIAGDLIDEPNETLTLTLSGPINTTIAGPASVTGTIVDDDPTPGITVADVTSPETGSLKFRVSLTNPSSQSVSVNYATQNGSATAGSDFVATSGTLTFAPGETSKDVLVQVLGDNVDEPNEFLLLALTNPTNAVVQRGEAAGTITDDDPTPLPSISSPSVAEGNAGTTQLVFTVTLSNPSSQTLAMNYATADGTATAGSDYTATSGILVFSPGETSKTVAVAVAGDTIYEPDETVKLEISYLGALWRGTGTVVNDDAIPAVSVSPTSVVEGGNGETPSAVFAVTLANPSSQSVTVSYRTVDGTAAAGAADFFYTTGTLTFAPGETSKSVAVAVRGDTRYEADETFTLELSAPTNATLGAAIAAGTIVNDDPVPGVRISTGSLAEGNSGAAAMVFIVTLTNPTDQVVTVDYATADGTATAGSDYTATAGTITFAPGNTGFQLLVAVLGDTTFEGTERFVVNLSNPTNAGLETASAEGIIGDDDFPTVKAAPASTIEGDAGTTGLAFALTLSNPSVEAVTVNYTTADGSASAGSDYAAAAGSVTFAPGQTSATVAISVLGDTRVEPDETFALGLTLPNGTNATLGTGSVTGTIVNDDRPSVSVAPASLAEGDSGTSDLTFTVSLSDPFTQAVTVDYATSGGSASAGTDFVAASGSVTFVPGETTRTVTVAVVGETILEADETLTLTLSNPQGGTLGTASAAGTIVNDDYAPTANAGADRSANEGAVVVFDASASSDADGDALTFAWAFGDGGTGTGVSPSHTYADDGTYTVTLTVSDGQGGVSTDTLTVTVLNVAPTAGVDGPATAVRGQGRTFTLSASDPSPADQAALFGYRIDWGDGSSGTANGAGSGVTAAHTFTAAGTYTVRVWAKDKDGAEGAAATRTVTVKTAELQGGDLVVGGTTAGDQIVVTPANTSGGVRVSINGADQGTFAPAGQLVVYAQAGDDTVSFGTLKSGKTTYRVDEPLLIFGGGGNDTLDARNSSGAAVLLGEAGNDMLYAGDGRALLVGGLGTDTLRGGGADDVLLGGVTDFDNDLVALAALRAEWARTDADYATRVGHLRGPVGGLNGPYFLDAARVHDDGGTADQLYGNGGLDWFFVLLGDRANDRRGNETATTL